MITVVLISMSAYGSAEVKDVNFNVAKADGQMICVKDGG